MVCPLSVKSNQDSFSTGNHLCALFVMVINQKPRHFTSNYDSTEAKYKSDHTIKLPLLYYNFMKLYNILVPWRIPFLSCSWWFTSSCDFIFTSFMRTMIPSFPHNEFFISYPLLVSLSMDIYIGSIEEKLSSVSYSWLIVRISLSLSCDDRRLAAVWPPGTYSYTWTAGTCSK